MSLDLRLPDVLVIRLGLWVWEEEHGSMIPVITSGAHGNRLAQACPSPSLLAWPGRVCPPAGLARACPSPCWPGLGMSIPFLLARPRRVRPLPCWPGPGVSVPFLSGLARACPSPCWPGPGVSVPLLAWPGRVSPLPAWLRGCFLYVSGYSPVALDYLLF